MSSNKVNCPFCEYSARADNLKRHIQNCHEISASVNVTLDNGCIYHPTVRKPYVVVSLTSEGSAKSCGYCFRCHEIIPNSAGATMSLYAGHPCKLGKGGKILPIPDTSFLAPEAAVATVSDGINWPAVIKDIEEDPVACKILQEKRIREFIDDDGMTVTHTLEPRDVILAAIKCSGLLRKCQRLETQSMYFQELNEQQDNEIVGLKQSVIDLQNKLDSITSNYSKLLGEAHARIVELTPDAIELTN
jgi:hypothetical protein